MISDRLLSSLVLCGVVECPINLQSSLFSPSPWQHNEFCFSEAFDNRLIVTISLDDGTPVLAPYQNNAMDAYTREALHVQEFTFCPTSIMQQELNESVEEYPKGARRLIISFTFYQKHFIHLFEPSLRFALN